jgi:hypothetical protein
LSAAVDVGFDLTRLRFNRRSKATNSKPTNQTKINFKTNTKTKFKTNTNSGGQECPPHIVEMEKRPEVFRPLGEALFNSQSALS